MDLETCHYDSNPGALSKSKMVRCQAMLSCHGIENIGLGLNPTRLAIFEILSQHNLILHFKISPSFAGKFSHGIEKSLIEFSRV